MGGDHAPSSTIDGALKALSESRRLSIILVGDKSEISAELRKKKFPSSSISIQHASQVVCMDDAPLSALRQKKDSSIRVSAELVKSGEADAMVSAGNSGVVMATALYLFKKIEGVERPAIATVMPTLKGFFILVDAGANVDCKANHLLQFAIMGHAYAKSIFKIDNPKIGLLGIGEEDAKGNELTKKTFQLLKQTGFDFIGNIEGKNVFMGDADVVVCDGFVGNITLKISEGLAEAMTKMLKREISENTTGKIGYALLRDAFKRFKKKIDYSEYGGAPLLGISRPCIISHGRSTSKAIKNAVRLAEGFCEQGALALLAEELQQTIPSRRKVASKG